jgi:Ca2+-binding RTX toxin-like protein
MAITASIVNGVLNVYGSNDPRGNLVQFYRFDNTRIGIRDYDHVSNRYIEYSVPSFGISQLRYEGGVGSDSVQVLPGLSLPGVFLGKDGNDFLGGAQFHGSVLLGGAGNDFLTGGSANDTLLGEAGDDVLTGGFGTDVMYGQTGIDTVSYIGRSERLTVFLDGRAISGALYENDTISADTENLIGGLNDDALYGNASSNVIRGSNGNDFIFGLDGNDQLYGENGNDYVHGGFGSDLIHGGAGSDQLDARDGGFLDVVIGKDSASQTNTFDVAFIDALGFQADSAQLINQFR